MTGVSAPLTAPVDLPEGVLALSRAGQTLVLWPGGALHWPQGGVLFVADLHVGKAATFRRLGVPVPQGSTSQTLARLTALLQATGARKVVFLGDLLHAETAAASDTLRVWQAWCEQHAQVQRVLVRGNHDRAAPRALRAFAVDVVDEPYALGPFRARHHPDWLPPHATAGGQDEAGDPTAQGYGLAGHWHPCIRLGGAGVDRLRLPCFWFGARGVVLPAFGAFTGMHPVQTKAGDALYVMTPQRVFAVPRSEQFPGRAPSHRSRL